MKIPFAPPFIDDDVKNEVLSALESGWITTGPKVKALEQETAKYAGIEHVLCVNSATSGLMTTAITKNTGDINTNPTIENAQSSALIASIIL